MIGRNRIGYRLQQHGLAGTRSRDDQATLPFADRREQVHHAAREIVFRRLHLQARLRVERRQIIEEDLVARFHRISANNPPSRRDCLSSSFTGPHRPRRDSIFPMRRMESTLRSQR